MILTHIDSVNPSHLNPAKQSMPRASRSTLLLLVGLAATRLTAQRQATVPPGVDSLRPPLYTDWSKDSIEALVVDLAVARLINAISSGSQEVELLLDPAFTTDSPPPQTTAPTPGGRHMGGLCANATPRSVAARAKDRGNTLRWFIEPRSRRVSRADGRVVFVGTFVVKGADGESRSTPIRLRFDSQTMLATSEDGVSRHTCEALDRSGGR